MRFCCLTCDVEIEKGSNELQKIVETLGDRACTFFIVPKHITQEIKKLLSKPNFELGLHVHWKGSYEKGLQSLSEQDIESQLSEEMKKFRKYFPKPVSFRGGGLCQTEMCLNVLSKHGFHIDSSMAAGLDEKNGWHQGHKSVGYRQWFSAGNLLEIPVTRLRPSGREWYPYTLSPESPLSGIIIRQKSFSENALLVPIFHSWGEGRLRDNKFPVFLAKLENMLKTIERKKYSFVTMSTFNKHALTGC